MMNQPYQPIKTQSNLGVASFFISLATFLLIMMLLIVVAMIDNRKSQMGDLAGTFFVICFFIIAPLSHLVGTTLGIIALFQKNRKKVFAILGIIFIIGFVSLGGFLVLLLLKAATAFR
jgi:hypothetical protein